MKSRTRLVENPELFIATDFLVATAATRWRVALDVHQSPIHHLAMVATASGVDVCLVDAVSW
ncbi:MAG: hypothetical protein ACKN81_05645 [Pirellulaceae bacterium]